MANDAELVATGKTATISGQDVVHVAVGDAKPRKQIARIFIDSDPRNKPALARVDLGDVLKIGIVSLSTITEHVATGNCSAECQVIATPGMVGAVTV